MTIENRSNKRSLLSSLSRYLKRSSHLTVELSDLSDFCLDPLSVLGNLQFFCLHPGVHVLKLTSLIFEVPILILHYKFMIIHKSSHLI